MKKLLVIAFLFIVSVSNAQETFVRTYTRSISVENDIQQPEKEIFITVTFNKGNSRFIEFAYSTGETLTFSQAGNVREGETRNGTKYQALEVINLEFGARVSIQLFNDDDTIRLHYSKGNYTEYYKY